MVLDEKLMRHCARARAGLQQAEASLAVARSEFERSVRRLYVEGASTREIAEALGLSHQRVHQLIGAAPKHWWHRALGLSEAPTQGCSFCGKSAPAVAKLVAGPGVHICDACIGAAEELTHAMSGKPLAPFVKLAETSPKRCSFCGRRGRDLVRVSARGRQICAACATTASKIAAETPAM